MRDAAVHRPLDTHTQATRARVRVKFRPQNSHVVKLERCAKLTDLSDLMLADRGVVRDVRDMEPQQPSGHRPEGFCCSIMVGRDVCHYCEVAERSVRRAVHAHRGAQAVLERPSEHRSTR